MTNGLLCRGVVKYATSAPSWRRYDASLASIPGLDLKFAYAGVRLESAMLFLLAD
jgi:hypothetical protein